MKVEHALEPVLRDMKKTGVPIPRVQFNSQGAEHSWLATLTASDGSSHGVFIDLSLPREYVVAAASEAAQEWVFDELQRNGLTNWPPCPLHPKNHPLDAVVVGGSPVWACPSENTVIAEIGELA